MTHNRLLGIDPGSRLTGFGIIDWQARKAAYISSGCVRINYKASLDQRLLEIFNAVEQLITTYQPSHLAIEKVFMHKNADAAIKLGQARGVAIACAAKQGLKFAEYSPNEIKQAVVGRGHADKQQVQHMVKVLLNLPGTPQADAADALAVALCHAYRHQSEFNT